MPEYDDVRLLNTVLTLYYAEEMTQADVAKRLDLSTAKVNRLLQQARDLGYVTYVIKTPYQHLFDVENRLKAVFKLEEAVVVPAVGDTSSSLLNSIGSVAADFVLSKIRDGDIIGITPGTSIRAVIQSIHSDRDYDVQIVPVLGNIQGDIESDMNYLAVHMGERLGAKAYQLHAPAYVDTKEHAEITRSMAPVKVILDIARQADMALLGVGSVDPDVSRFVEFTALSAEDLDNIAEGCGGVGEISAHVYNINGEPCSPETSDRVIGLTLEEISQIPYRIGVAAGAAKALPLYGALCGGYLHALITDEVAANGILELFDKRFGKTP